MICEIDKGWWFAVYGLRLVVCGFGIMFSCGSFAWFVVFMIVSVCDLRFLDCGLQPAPSPS
jgi:hypothetical protein